MGTTEHDDSVQTEERQETKEPDQYRVLLHNDDYTPMDFIVDILVSVFKKSAQDATRIMLDVHRKGKGVVGTYTYDVAASRIQRVHTEARSGGYPLRATMEPA